MIATDERLCQPRSNLIYRAKDKLQIASLWEVRRDRMIERLTGFMEDEQAFALVGRCLAERLSKQIGRDITGAACRRQQPMWSDTAQRQFVQFGIAAQRRMQVSFLVGEARRVQNHQIKRPALAGKACQERKAILDQKFIAIGIKTIEREIGRRLAGAGRSAVAACDGARAAPRGVERERACIRETVENGSPLAPALQKATVLTMIQEEAGFLTLKEIGVEAQSILFNDEITRGQRAPKALDLIALRWFFRSIALLRAPPQENSPQGRRCPQALYHPGQQRLHALAISVQDCEGAIEINRDTRQAIRLTKDPAIGADASRSQRRAHLPGDAHALAYPGGIRQVAGRKQAQRDLALGVPEAIGAEAAAARPHPRARWQHRGRLNLVAIDPGMACRQPGL